MELLERPGGRTRQSAFKLAGLVQQSRRCRCGVLQQGRASSTSRSSSDTRNPDHRRHLRPADPGCESRYRQSARWRRRGATICNPGAAL